jgi:hypothetical protein
MSMGWPNCRFFAGQAKVAIIHLFRPSAKPAPPRNQVYSLLKRADEKSPDTLGGSTPCNRL